nr:MAG TPA: hypothetical protein [Caudoviricetes sp.]
MQWLMGVFPVFLHTFVYNHRMFMHPLTASFVTIVDIPTVIALCISSYIYTFNYADNLH